MVGEAKVTEGTDGALPEADATISFEEFKFIGVEGLKAGNPDGQGREQGAAASPHGDHHPGARQDG